jgi:N-acetylneuraminic acid mutarotase
MVSVKTVLRLPVGVSRTVLLASGTQLLALGGLAAGDTTTGRIWSIDTSAVAARQVGTLSAAVHDASGAFLGGAAVVFGGGAATTVAAVQAWVGRRTTTVGSLPQPRSDSAAATIGATAYVVGGFTGQGMARDVLATTNGRTFRKVGRLGIGVRYPAVAAVGGYVYVVGGELATTEGTLAGRQTDAVQRIDPASGQVRVIGHLGRGLGHATAFALDGRLFVAGGRHGATATADVIEVDVHNGGWRRVGRLPRAMSDAAAAVVGSVAWLVGGETTGPSAPVNTVLTLRVQG